MAKLSMEKKAGDNKYLHKDFHILADIGIRYVGERFGDDAVREYLKDFALSYYKPLIDRIKKEGLAPLKRYIQSIYCAEEAKNSCSITEDKGSLKVHIESCPAVQYMKDHGHTPSKWYKYTSGVVFAALAEAAGLGFTLERYDDDSGAASFEFCEGEKL